MIAEKNLLEIFPKLCIHFNCKNAIGSELDIYIPSLKMAIEINGIFHYEPIYGEDKLNQIISNDSLKKQSCDKNNISLYVVDVSQLSYLTEKTAQPYINKILNIINGRSPRDRT